MAPFNCVQLLIKENDADVKSEAVSLLMRILYNILNHPNEKKFRSIKIEPHLTTRLFPAAGGMECLYEIGFVEDDEYFTLPESVSIENVRAVYDEISKYSLTSPSKEDEECKESKTKINVNPRTRDLKSQIMSDITSHTQLAKLRNNCKGSINILDYIPDDLLKNKVMERLSSLENVKENDLLEKDIYLLELLLWFKEDFFSWVDRPKCSHCNSDTASFGSDKASLEEAVWVADRVELYRCQVCGAITRFPRYSNPIKLLSTKRGRCGEWANCFAFICQCLGYGVRQVFDRLDHTWCEVFGMDGRWIHCDPCEGVMDRPLMYEKGWGKRYLLVLACGESEVQDVTWRYVRDHVATLEYREEQGVDEQWLASTILNINRKYTSNMSSELLNAFYARQLRELCELCSPPQLQGGEGDGRTSGSLAWRLARGETAGAGQPGFVLKPNEREVRDGYLEISYTPSDDVWRRKMGEEKKGWASFLYRREMIGRKVERDWGMVYLARMEGLDTHVGMLEWRVEAGDVNVRSVGVTSKSTVYGSGEVKWQLVREDSGEEFQISKLVGDGNDLSDNESHSVFIKEGTNKVTIRLLLSGSNNWQHAQVSRQRIDDVTAGLTIRVNLTSKLT